MIILWRVWRSSSRRRVPVPEHPAISHCEGFSLSHGFFSVGSRTVLLSYRMELHFQYPRQVFDSFAGIIL